MKLFDYSLKEIKKLYKAEGDTRVRERLQIVLHLREGYKERAVAQIMHVSNGKVHLWKERFESEGIEGLYDKEGRGCKAKLGEEELSMIGSALAEGYRMKNGYTRPYKTKDVAKLISDNFELSYTVRHVRRILRSIGFRLLVPRPRHKRRNQGNVEEFKQEFQKKKAEIGEGHVIVTYDQAKFCIDADVRRGWALAGETPIVYKNGSKKSISIGGAYSSTGEFIYHKMDWQTKEAVLWNIKHIHAKFPKMLLLLDKAPWNKNKTVLNYLERENIPYMFFPTGAPDRNPTELCWGITREEVTANESHDTEEDLYRHLVEFWRGHFFTHNVLNYLSP